MNYFIYLVTLPKRTNFISCPQNSKYQHLDLVKRHTNYQKLYIWYKNINDFHQIWQPARFFGNGTKNIPRTYLVIIPKGRLNAPSRRSPRTRPQSVIQLARQPVAIQLSSQPCNHLLFIAHVISVNCPPPKNYKFGPRTTHPKLAGADSILF